MTPPATHRGLGYTSRCDGKWWEVLRATPSRTLCGVIICFGLVLFFQETSPARVLYRELHGILLVKQIRSTAELQLVAPPIDVLNVLCRAHANNSIWCTESRSSHNTGNNRWRFTIPSDRTLIIDRYNCTLFTKFQYGCRRGTLLIYSTMQQSSLDIDNTWHIELLSYTTMNQAALMARGGRALLVRVPRLATTRTASI